MFKINFSMIPDGTTTPKSPVKMMKDNTLVMSAVKKEIMAVL